MRGLKEITEVSSLQRKQRDCKRSHIFLKWFHAQGALCNGELLHEAWSHINVNESQCFKFAQNIVLSGCLKKG